MEVSTTNPQTAAAQFSKVLIIFFSKCVFYRLSLMLLVGVCDYAEFTILEQKEANWPRVDKRIRWDLERKLMESQNVSAQINYLRNIPRHTEHKNIQRQTLLCTSWVSNISWKKKNKKNCLCRCFVCCRVWTNRLHKQSSDHFVLELQHKSVLDFLAWTPPTTSLLSVV